MGSGFGDYSTGRLRYSSTRRSRTSPTRYPQLGYEGFRRRKRTAQGREGRAFPYVAWGTAFVDFDQNDGWPDIFIANGHVTEVGREKGCALSQPSFAHEQARRDFEDGFRSRRGWRVITLASRSGWSSATLE